MSITTSGRTRGRWGHRIALSLTTILVSGLGAPAMAQTFTPQERQAPDENGVDVISGAVSAPLRSIVAGPSGQGGLAYNYGWAAGKFYDTFNVGMIGSASVPSTIKLIILGSARNFSYNSSTATWSNDDGDGATFALNPAGTAYIYTARDGSIFTFLKSLKDTGTLAVVPARISTIERPDGEVITYTHRLEAGYTHCDPNFNCVIVAAAGRVQSVTSSRGYQLKPKYASDTFFRTGVSNDDFNRLISVKAINNAVDYCSPVTDSCTGFTQVWPELTLGTSISGGVTTTAFTDPASQTTTVTSTATGIKSITSPADATADISMTYDGNGRVATLTKGGGSWAYAYSDSGSTRTTTVTQPIGGTKVYVSDLTLKRVTSVTDELGHTTNFQYDSSARLTRTTLPEGNYVESHYDARGNVTQTDGVGKAGSGAATITTYAGYDPTCGNMKTCNQPNTITDARGNVTDFTYDSTHGGVLTVTAPAPTMGAVRPETRYSYTAKTAYYKNSAGSIVAAPSSIYELTAVSACQTGSSCSGTSDEVKTSIDYGSTGVANNLLPVAVTTGAGDGSLTATTAATYDVFGDVITVDGPLSGAADTVRYRYDSDRQLVGVVSPDPDGAGSLKPRAQRTTYNGDGNVILVESGTVNSQSDADWAAMSVSESVETGYDTLGRPTLSKLRSGLTTYAVSQVSYDAKGRPECATMRMNSARFALPPAACTLDTAGSFGPDRITKTIYDNANQVTQVQTGFGTPDQVNETSRSYTDNGKVASLTDAEGNETSYTYDGHDRLSKTSYPSATKGAGTSSSTDYEELIYDAGSNVTSQHLRGYSGDSTKHIDLTYDTLNRLTAKDLPGSEPDVSYTYDLLGRMTGASQTGNALTFSYDALGRNLTQAGPMGTVSYQYDAAGQRTRLTWPDSFYVTYDHLVTGEESVIRENGATSGVGVLATYAYDDLGRRTSLTYGNGTVSTYAYDNVSRLASLAHNLDGATTTNDVTTTFGYSPAGAITTQTRSNDLYSWDGHFNVGRSYTSNGLNQYTAVGATSPTYDARGNLTGSGSDSYGYSSENLMTSATVASTASTLDYDPALRLFKVTSGGTGTRFEYDDREIITTYSDAGAITSRYVRGPGADEPLVAYTGSGTSTRSFMHADERGSVVAFSDSSGAKTSVNSYDEYGIPYSGNTGRFQYTGQMWMPQLGMYYYKARMYSPTLGRFMETDPIGYRDGMNIYAYVGNSPINFDDPMGLDRVYSTTTLDGTYICNFTEVGEKTTVVCYSTVPIAVKGGSGRGGRAPGGTFDSGPGNGPGGGARLGAAATPPRDFDERRHRLVNLERERAETSAYCSRLQANAALKGLTFGFLGAGAVGGADAYERYGTFRAARRGAVRGILSKWGAVFAVAVAVYDFNTGADGDPRCQ